MDLEHNQPHRLWVSEFLIFCSLANIQKQNSIGTGIGLGTNNTLFGQNKPGGLFGTNTAPSGGLFGSSFGQTNTLGGMGQNTMGM